MRILAVEHALPRTLVSNDDLIERVLRRSRLRARGAKAALRDAVEAYFARTGAQARYHRAPDELAVSLGIAAGRRVLDTAGIAAEEIDLLVYTGVGRGWLEPASANVFHHALGLRRATCFDLLDACASWVRALDLAHHYLQVGAARRVMLLNCECSFAEYARLDLRSPADLVDFGAGLTIGEAATATILGPSGSPGEYRASFRTNGEHYGLCQIPLPHARQFTLGGTVNGYPPLAFYARSTELYRAALTQLAEQYRADPVLAGNAPDVVLSHAVSLPASRWALESLQLDPATHVEIFPTHGNTVSASVPLAMSLAIRDGRLRRGHEVLAVVGSAGLTTAFCRFRY